MRFLRVAMVCCVMPPLSGCIVGKAIGAAVDVTATAATAAVKVTGAVVETTVDVVTPEGEDDGGSGDGGEESGTGEDSHTSLPENVSYDGGGNSSHIDRPRP